MAAGEQPSQRYCLITVGATVGFEQLTKTALEPLFWQFLQDRGFSNLRIQCGPDVPWASAKLAQIEHEVPPGFSVDVFDVRRNLMLEEMVLCKPTAGQRGQGLIVSHAGTGTILDAWKVGVPLIVVPNTGLLDDHQTELAKHLAREGYATMAKPSRLDLQDAIHKAELLVEENKTRWPPHSVSNQQRGAARLWDIKPVEVKAEEVSQMTHD
ncbi:N-acetylglucosaminyldiphosphodolichol N-acetylglucosaminyltransferase [Purpureocillium takamizusanense]|uniref:UDP-N-acetylglucosamine transferase subunit ALG13 n=1 Tax=Purpureocillium takamizusanense TaxID=2060973 RepID=A0A9Q8QGX5_9HYPO|nr:N-acetylglucosaminyldiphosphodolichol N-acetylglucosaminyltransferase [Purpureocillium takamizusanense]UNI20694.1 N-acetylglucosaminyldiphosphodolichol N-acetylglucosaminyltransferase [Purpureocillium takamizusanense]